MISTRKTMLYVDRFSQRWIVQDQEGKFWSLPNGEDAWNQREPFCLTDDTDLEPVPSHYKYLLGLPD
jgi:hypothetical protein